MSASAAAKKMISEFNWTVEQKIGGREKLQWPAHPPGTARGGEGKADAVLVMVEALKPRSRLEDLTMRADGVGQSDPLWLHELRLA